VLVELESDPNISPEALLIVGDALPAIEARLDPAAPADAFTEARLESAAPADALSDLALDADPSDPKVESNPAPD
jgi:hypothetical protein